MINSYFNEPLMCSVSVAFHFHCLRFMCKINDDDGGGGGGDDDDDDDDAHVSRI